MDAIATRLVALENSNRRLRIITSLLITTALVAAALGVSRAAHVPEVVRARSLEIVSEDGVIVAKLTESPEGGILTLFDNEAKPALWLAATREGNRVRVFDAEGRIAVGIAANPDGNAVRILNPNGEKAVLLAATPAVNGIGLWDADGAAAVGIDSSADGNSLTILNADTKPIVRLGQAVNRAGAITIHNDNGTPLIGLVHNAIHERGQVVQYDRDGAPHRAWP